MPPKAKFSREFREQAVKAVTETSRPIAQVAQELGLKPTTLGNWVRKWRMEQQVVIPSSGGKLTDSPPPAGPLHPETAELVDASSVDNFDLGDDEPSGRSDLVTTSAANSRRHRVRPSTAITIAADAFLYIIIVNPFSKFLAGLCVELALVAVLSQAARESLHSSLASIFILVGLVACFDIGGYLYQRSTADGRIMRIFFGKPSMGRLGGPSQATFRLAMQMYKQFSMEVAPEDEEAISVVQSLDLEVTESFYRAKYIKARQLDGASADQASHEWTEKQRKRVLSRSYDEVSLEDTYKKSLVWQVFMYRLGPIGQRAGPLITIGLAVSVWLYAREIETKNYLLPLQVVLLTGFLFTAVVFANITYLFSVVRWEKPTPIVLRNIADQGLRTRLTEGMAPYVGKIFWPVKVTFGERYARLVSGYFLRFAAASLSFLSIATLFILLICAAVGALGSGGPGIEWYYHMAVALAAIPALLFLSIYVAFLILRIVGSLVAVVTAALILAATPPGLTFLFTGKSPGKDAVTSSIVAGLAGALATAIADRTKGRVQRVRQ